MIDGLFTLLPMPMMLPPTMVGVSPVATPCASVGVLLASVPCAFVPVPVVGAPKPVEPGAELLELEPKPVVETLPGVPGVEPKDEVDVPMLLG